MKLRYKLNLLIISLIILSISIPSIIYYYFSRQMLKEQVDSYLQLELNKNMYDISGWIDTQSQAVVIISDIIQNVYEKEDITKDLLQSYISNKNISDIYIGFSDGSFLSGTGWIPQKGYDPRNRPWYQEVMNAGKLNISNIYFDYTSNQYAVAIGIPLIDKNTKFLGVLSEDILLNTIYEEVLNIKLDNNGYAYLMDLDGNILIHEDKNLIGKNFNNLITNNEKFNFSKQQYGEQNYTYSDKGKIAIFNRLENTNWILALTVDEEEVYKPLSKLLWIYLTIVVTTMIFAIFITRIFYKKILHRLKLLSDASTLLSKGDFEIGIEDSGKDEIGDVFLAFNRMKCEIKETILQLNSSRMKYEELIENTADAIYSVDSKGYLITGNTVFLDMFGIHRDVIGKELFSNLVQHAQLGSILISLGIQVQEKGQLINRKLDNIDKHYYNVTLSPIMDKDSLEVKGVTTILHDNSDLELSRNHLEWITHHDVLTQLPNRFKLMEDMYTIILKAKISNESFAILFIDLDDFSNINDTLGYSMGDIVLQKIGNMLNEQYVTYRIGADEFALLLEDFNTPNELHKKVTDISKMLNHSFEIDLNTIYNSATIGVVVYPNDFSNINEMMARADAALNYAKNGNKSEIQYYDYSISHELEKHVLLEKGLRKALDLDEFLLYYQPIMNSLNKNIKGFEALIRWRKNDGKVISPGEFMPVAENMSLIYDIGLWVITQALHDLKMFQKKSKSALTMAINLSANQIKRYGFCEEVIKIIEQSGVDPHDIEFEITESVLIESLDVMKRQFERLINLGVKISLDDFGTGYSSLNYIQHFPFQILKIDKCFIDYIRQETTSKSLVNYIIDIAHGMEMEIVAEGVENELQESYLLERKCDYLQGYLFSKPIPKEDVYDFIQENSNK